MGNGFARKWLIPIPALAMLLQSGCLVGPNYHPTPVAVPLKYKEAFTPAKGWKKAQPRDDIDRGRWWVVFKDAELDALESQLNVGNQNLALVLAQYDQSLALEAEAQSAMYPIVSSFVSVTRQKPPASTFNSSSGTGTGGQTQGKAKSLPPFSTYILSFNASWTPDLWGSVRRTVEASSDTAQATAALVASTRLSAQATLAQDYFQLRTQDALQKLFNDIVKADQRLLTLTRSRYQAGTASLADIAITEAQLQAAQAAAIDTGVSRAQFEHAIAVLIGQPPAIFSIKPKVLPLQPPIIPAQVPSELLERRPDIAQAEREVASANAQIGVAEAAFYPTLPLTASSGFQSNQFSQWFSGPSSFWVLGAELMDTIFDGGLRSATEAAAIAVYHQTMATYRQTVLAAFQNVEDGLSTQRILKQEAAVDTQAVATAKLSLRLTTYNYQAGTSDITTVLTAQNTAYSIEQNQVTVIGRQMVAAVELIAALGGGWSTCPTIEANSVPTPLPPRPFFKLWP